MTTTSLQFGTDEILWYDNGKWGETGYAIANPNGKIWTNNSVIFGFHSLVGRNMFELMHRSDVRFYGPPHKQFWFELHQLIVTARKRLADRQRLPNDSNGLVVAARHADAADLPGLADSVLRRARAAARYSRVRSAGAAHAVGDDAALGERAGHVHHRRFCLEDRPVPARDPGADGHQVLRLHASARPTTRRSSCRTRTLRTTILRR